MNIETQALKCALEKMDAQLAFELFEEMTHWSVVDFALDEDDAVLYAAVLKDGQTRGYCAYVNDEAEFVVVAESDGPLFLGAPANLINCLDITFCEHSVRWRRDCLARFYRNMALDAKIGHPCWTAFYSEQPLGQMKHSAHIAVLVGGAPSGKQEVAITDGTGWRLASIPVMALNSLVPLWPLEWESEPHSILAMRGRGALRYVGVGPPEFRVGMLFNDMGGLLTWSCAASHCELMATLAEVEESGFSRTLMMSQLNQWQGRSATVG